MDNFTLISIAGVVVLGIAFLYYFFVHIVWRKNPKYDGLHNDRYDVSPQFPRWLLRWRKEKNVS